MSNIIINSRYRTANLMCKIEILNESRTANLMCKIEILNESNVGYTGNFFPQANHHPPLSPTAENVMTRYWNAHAPLDNARHADWLNGNRRKESDKPLPSPDNNKFRTNPLLPGK